MRPSIRRPALLILFAACAVTAGATRQRDSRPFEERRKAIEAKVLSVADAPVRLEIAPSGSGYDVCNHRETAAMVGFRFGCAEQGKGGFKVLERRPPKEMHGMVIGPRSGGEVTCYTFVMNHGVFPEALCEAGKLAVVEAEFADGTLWELESAAR